MNMVWEIIDWYNQAILLARELDMEQEAIVMQRNGRVYGSEVQTASKGVLQKSHTVGSIHGTPYLYRLWYLDNVLYTLIRINNNLKIIYNNLKYTHFLAIKNLTNFTV